MSRGSIRPVGVGGRIADRKLWTSRPPAPTVSSFLTPRNPHISQRSHIPSPRPPRTAWGGPKREAAKGLPFLSDPNAVDGSMYTPHQRRVLGLETGADSVGGYQGARRDEAHERPLQLLAIAPRAQASKKNKNGGSGRLDKGKFIDMSPEGDARSR